MLRLNKIENQLTETKDVVIQSDQSTRNSIPSADNKDQKLNLSIGRLQNKTRINKHNRVIQQHFDFNIEKTSHINLRKMRQLVLAAKSLSKEEIEIYELIQNNMSLKHATNAINEIRKSKMLAIRTLEESGVSGARHTAHAKGADRSIYFTCGIGEHATPEFVNKATHVITVDLAKMYKQDELSTKRFWVGSHLDEYINNSEYQIILGNALFKVKFFDSYKKSYTVSHAETKEVIFTWNIDYKDEIFSGYDVLPGIALKFIYILRKFGGMNNPLVKKLYDSCGSARLKLLQKIFSTVMPGWIYPEGKIIKEFDINKKYVSVDATKNKCNNLERAKFDAVKHAIKSENLEEVELLINKGYPVTDPFQVNPDNLLKAAIKIENQDLRHAMLKLLIKKGACFVEHINKVGRVGYNLLHEVAEKGTSDDLSLLLSSVYPDREEPMIAHVPDPNSKCGSYQRDFDLIEIVCRIIEDDSVRKLQILKQHGADFNKDRRIYLDSAIKASKKSSDDYRYVSNLPVLLFFKELNISLKDDDFFGESPLMTASRLGCLEAAKILVEQLHADVNFQLKFFYRSLLSARSYYDDPNNRKTALHFAAEKGHKEMIQYLLSQGANPNLKTSRGRLPIDLVDKDKKEIQALLLERSQGTEKKETKADAGETNQYKMNYRKVAVIVKGNRPQDNKPYVVLGRRRNNEESKTNSSYYCFPGGSASHTDLSLETAAARELFEETGIKLGQIPNAKIEEFTAVDGFKSDDHRDTTFFFVDIGNYPVEVHPSDDFIAARKVLLEELKVNPQAPVAKMMQFDRGRGVLGSNALLICNKLLRVPVFMEQDFKELLRQQLFVEDQGVDQIFKVVDEVYDELQEQELEDEKKVSSQSDPFAPNTEGYKKLQNLFSENAHLSPREFYLEGALIVKMAKMSSIHGLNLLHQHGICLRTMTRNGDTALSIAVKNNNAAMIECLLKLDSDLLKIEGYQRLLQAVKLGYFEIAEIFISHGIDPNSSYSYNQAGGSRIIHPLMGDLVKENQFKEMGSLLAKPNLYLNRERSPFNRNSTLMTAIDYDRKEAALELLATFKLDVRLVNKHKQTAYAMALNKKWNDLAELIQFISRYSDMNDYLRHYKLPVMNAFEIDDKNNLIQFKTTVSHDLVILAKAIDGTSNIQRQGHNLFSITLNEAQLAVLLKSQFVANFLLTKARSSIFWVVQNDQMKNFAYGLLTNQIKLLIPQWFDQYETWNNKEYYHQLICESAGIKDIQFQLDSLSDAAYDGFLKAIHSHDKVEQATLIMPDKKSDKPIVERLKKALLCLSTLKSLGQIECHFFSMPQLLELIHWANNMFKTNNKVIKIIIRNRYRTDEYQYLLAEIDKMEFSHNLMCLEADNPIQFAISQKVAKKQIDYFMKDIEFKDYVETM